MLTRKVEDYLEAIYNIIERKGYARTKDIADELMIKPPSVCEMVKKLDERRLVNYEKYSGVILTHKGEEIAKAVKERHDALIKLLKIMHLPDEIAERDACTIEHHLHPKTIVQIKKFVKFVENSEWQEDFKIYNNAHDFEGTTSKN